METISHIPVPKDIPLDLPSDPHNLKLLVIFVFLLHILFVNLMIGSTLFSLVFEFMGLKKKDYDQLARRITSTIAVNKSLAVVLGVAPLLTLNVLYTVYFYTANSLTGIAWIMVVPLVSVAFLLGYVYKYTWDRLAHQKGVHMAIGAGAAILFLLIPFIFLSNINLMQFPDRWPEVGGWLSTVILPNVIPRYIHFIIGSIAVSGLFFAGYFTVREYPAEKVFEELDRPKLRQIFYSIAFSATAANFLAGPLLLFTLPTQGLSWTMVGIIFCGVALAVIAFVLLWREIVTPKITYALRFYMIIALLTGTVIFMATGRQVYRENAISPHRQAMDDETLAYMSMVNVAQWRLSQGLGIAEGDASLSPGEKVFQNVCATCHALDQRLVGPSLKEIAEIYKDDIDGMIQWIKDPGKKRPDYPPMPAIKLSESQYQAVANYVLDQVFGKEESEEQESQKEETEKPKASKAEVDQTTQPVQEKEQEQNKKKEGS